MENTEEEIQEKENIKGKYKGWEVKGIKREANREVIAKVKNNEVIKDERFKLC